ncbi:MAG TPA: hypothetical protein VNM69_06580 [Bacillus sp. (in: firmicutes)]|nr:hypothetical protein [Bacillus sp. (in: firmicutes)]
MKIRKAVHSDIQAILDIYNKGIVDRIATLETDPKDIMYMEIWFKEHQERFAVLVAEIDGKFIDVMVMEKILTSTSCLIVRGSLASSFLFKERQALFYI